MYKITVLQNPVMPELIKEHTLFPDTKTPFLQYRVKMRSANSDKLLQKITDARDDMEHCYFEFRDILGNEHSYPVLSGWKTIEDMDGVDREVIYLDLMAR